MSKRDAHKRTLLRHYQVRNKVSDDGLLELVACTDEPVRMGGYREILKHDADSIDFRGASALLINHDPNQIAGSIEGYEVRDGQTLMTVRVHEKAMLQSGLTVREAVNSGALRGVSMAYDYDMERDAEYDKAERLITVNRWRFMEVTLTPIPADQGAGVRTHPYADTIENQGSQARNTPEKGANMDYTEWLKARGLDEAKLTEEQNKKARAICEAGGELPDGFAVSAIDEKARAEEIRKLREANAKLERSAKLRAIADEHGVTGLDFDGIDSIEEGQRQIMAKLGERHSKPAHGAPVTQVTRDAADKVLERANGALHAIAQVEADEGSNLDVRGMSLKQLIRTVARSAGESLDDATDIEVASWFQRNVSPCGHGQRDAANKVTGQFSSLLANVANKAVQSGINEYDAATWDQFSTVREVADFKQVTNTNLASGRLTKTPENEAFPELTQADTAYNSTLGLWGATVSLTMQMIVNDDLGGFMRELRRAGAISALTVDREVYYQILNATWTNDVSTSSGLSTLANLDKPRAALKEKLSPAGEKMGINARFLLHDPANAIPAQQATGAISAGGQTTPPSLGSRQIRTIESHWIGDTGLKSGVATTDYYLTGNPSVHDTVLVNFLSGVGRTPIIMPYDPGAVAAEKWKIMLPFVATVATHTDSADATRVSGMQKATA